RSSFDPLLVVISLKNPLHINARGVNRVRIQFSRFYQLFNFDNGDIGSSGHDWVEVSSGLAIDQIAVTISLPGLDKGVICTQRKLKKKMFPVPRALPFPFRFYRAIPRGVKKPADACPAGPDAFCEGSLGIELNLQFSVQHQFLEKPILSDISRDHFL